MIFAKMFGDVVFCENIFLVMEEYYICPKTQNCISPNADSYFTSAMALVLKNIYSENYVCILLITSLIFLLYANI